MIYSFFFSFVYTSSLHPVSVEQLFVERSLSIHFNHLYAERRFELLVVTECHRIARQLQDARNFWFDMLSADLTLELKNSTLSEDY